MAACPAGQSDRGRSFTLAVTGINLNQPFSFQSFLLEILLLGYVDRGLRVQVPIIPEIVVLGPFRDAPEGIPHLLFVKFTESPGPVHSSVHLVGLCRAWGPTEMAYSTTSAGFNVFNFPTGYQLKCFCFQDVFNVVLKKVAAFKFF